MTLQNVDFQNELRALPSPPTIPPSGTAAGRTGGKRLGAGIPGWQVLCQHAPTFSPAPGLAASSYQPGHLRRAVRGQHTAESMTLNLNHPENPGKEGGPLRFRKVQVILQAQPGGTPEQVA